MSFSNTEEQLVIKGDRDTLKSACFEQRHQKIKDLLVRLEDAKATVLKREKESMQSLEQRVRELENELENEQEKDTEAYKNKLSECERFRKLQLQMEDDNKKLESMPYEDLVDDLKQRMNALRKGMLKNLNLPEE